VGRVTISRVGRCATVGLALLAGCSFDTSGGQGDNDGGTPPIIDGGSGDDGGGGDDDGGGPCMTGALDFSPDDWVEVDDDSLDLSNDFTVEAWVRPREVSGEYHIVSRHDDGASQGYVLMIKDSLPEFRLYFADDSGPPSRCECKKSGEEVAADTWVHLAGSFSDGDAYLFKNGVLLEICDCAELCGNCVGDAAPYGGPMTIGIEASRLDRYAADGLIDDVHVLGRALTASFEPLQAAVCATETLLLFRFESPVGQELSSGCGAAATGRLGSEAGADLNDPDQVDVSCPSL
jgi:hypothetical protein